MINKNFDLVIVGGGPAGLYSLYYSTQKGINSCLCEASNQLGGQLISLYPHKQITNYPSINSITGKELAKQFITRAEINHSIFLNTSLLEIKKNKCGYQLFFSNNLLIFCRYLIIATGNGCYEFNKITGQHFNNIHYVVKDINIYKDKDIIILGGGDSAIDWALEIKKICPKSLTIIHRRSEFRTARSNIQKTLNNNQINVILNCNSVVTGQHTLIITDISNGLKKDLYFDFLIVQYGVSINRENNKFLQPFNKDYQNRIIINEKCQTNLDNIYAIGDIAVINNKPRLIINAQADAITAVNNIIYQQTKK